MISSLYFTKDYNMGRNNTYAKTCNSILYTYTKSATYIGSLFGTTYCLYFKIL